MDESQSVARFSPGPWWGFNGVDLLKVSNEGFTREHRRLIRGRVTVVVPIESVVMLSLETVAGKRSGQPEWVRMILLVEGVRQTFIGHIDDGMPFADALSSATGSGR